MHSFDPADADRYGILEAVLLANIRWWVAKNEANNKHFHDGCYWTYNSAKAFSKMFWYASQQQIQRALKRLEEAGVLKVGNYNTNPYDHTKWYSVQSNLMNRQVQDDQPSNTDINTDTSLSGSIPTVPFNDLIDIYEKHLPELPVVRKSLFATGANAKATKQRWDWVMTSVHEKGARAGQRLAQTPEQALEWFDKFFGFVSQSDFLTGRDKAWTGCNLGWLMNRSNFEKVLSGQYHKKD